MPREIRWLSSATAPFYSLALATLLCGSIVQATAETATLVTRIDALVSDGNSVPVAGGIDDLTFLRRIYLDFTGRVPTSGEARAFLADASPSKRAAMIDTLLEGREFALHMATTFDIWLMERRRDSHVKSPDWKQFLLEAFTANKPYNVLVREILAADGAEAETRAAARFYLDRLGESHVIARDVGRIFFGMDFQCAQCHDHPNVDDYLQRDYYGLLAFFNRTSLFHPDTSKPSALAEKAEGESTYASVFTKVKGAALPQLPGGSAFPDPDLGEAERYKVPPNEKDKNVRPVPTYSRRGQLAQAVASAAESNQAFNRNIANRLWAHMMGRGLVEPFDFHHSANPPSHPELLDLLGREFSSGRYDIRSFLRQLALTNTYQRSFELPESLASQATDAAKMLPELDSLVAAQAGKLRQARNAREKARAAWHKRSLEYEKVAAPLIAAEKRRGEAIATEKKQADALTKVKAELAAKENALGAVQLAAKEAAAAATLLPDDKELAEASATIAARRDAIQKELKEGAKPIQAGETALTAAKEKVDEANEEVAAARENADVEKASVLILEAAFNDAHDAFRQAQSELKISERLLADARELVNFAKLQEAASRERASAGLAAEATEAQMERSANVERHLLNLTLAANRSVAALGTEPNAEIDVELAAAAQLLRSRRDASAREFRQQAELATAQLMHNDEAQALLRKSLEASAAARESLTERLNNTFAVGVFAPLMPEQLCMSTATATGQRDRTLAAGRAEFDKKLAEQAAAAEKAKKAAATGNAEQAEPNKETETPAPPALLPEQRDSYVEDYVRTQFEGSLQQYVRLFGGQQGQPQTDFYATADQALFLANNGLVRGWLSPGGDNLTHRLKQLERPEDLAEELYLSVLTRLPVPDETRRVSGYLAARPGDRDNAIQELAWALLSSVEFRFRH